MSNLKLKVRTGSYYIDKYGASHGQAIIVPTEVKNNTYKKQLTVIFSIFHNQDSFDNGKPSLDKFQVYVDMNTNRPSKGFDGQDIHIRPDTNLSTVAVLGYPDYDDFWNFFDLNEFGLAITSSIGLFWLLYTTDLNVPETLELPLNTYWEDVSA